MKTENELRYEDAAEQRTTTLWCCKRCNKGYREERLARYCCAESLPCDECGGRKKKPYTCCDDCRRKKEVDREAARLAKATAVEDCDNGCFYGDDFYSSVEEFMERHWDDREPIDELPQYVWCCKGQTLSPPDLAGLIGDADEWPSEDYGKPDLDGLEPIQALLDEWCKSKGVVSYVPDYTRYVLLDWSGYENSH